MRVAVVGAGGCAREVAWTIRDLARSGEELEFSGYVVSNRDKLGPLDSVAEVIGEVDEVLERGCVDGLVMGIGNPVVRLAVAESIAGWHPHVAWPSIIHPSAQFDRDSAKFSRGVVICASSVLTVNIELGEFAMVHYGCTVGHESRLGRGSVLNPGANIAGGVSIGEAVMIGSGAVVLQYLAIGDSASIGAGAVVTKNVPEGQTWVGVPAQRLKRKQA